MFRKEQKALVIGGTGSLGKALIPKLIKMKHDITVLSRDELKQKEMKARYPQLKYVLGDVRDYDSIARHCLGVHAVFHLAAMKHIEMAEANVHEAIKINLEGSINVAEACINGHVSHAVLSSTDKAVLPINVYGMCKALAERYWLAQNEFGTTDFSVFRWGNVLGSWGSVIHAFVKSLKEERKVYITNTAMSRFWIHIDDAADFICENYEFNTKEALIPQMKGADLTRLAKLTAHYLGITSYETKLVGVRPGEKIHECLHYIDEDEPVKLTSNNCLQYADEELLALIERTLDGPA